MRHSRSKTASAASSRLRPSAGLEGVASLAIGFSARDVFDFGNVPVRRTLRNSQPAMGRTMRGSVGGPCRESPAWFAGVE